MSYMIEKFESGKVHQRGNVFGWKFTNPNEFRPLMNDAMTELFDAGLVSATQVTETQAAYVQHTTAFLAEYIERNRDREPSEEEKFEMRAAFGKNTTVVNVLTGRKTHL